MDKQDAAVMVLDSGAKVEDAVRALARGGFDMRTISVVGAGLTVPPASAGLDDATSPATRGGASAGPGTGVWGLLEAPSMIRLPGVGAVPAGGPLAVALGRASMRVTQPDPMPVIGNALQDIGVPRGRIVKYELALKAGKCLLMIHADDDSVARALAILAEAWAWEVA